MTFPVLDIESALVCFPFVMRFILQEALALLGLLFYSNGCSANSPAPYSEYILAPSSRTVIPSSVHGINGTILNVQSLTTPNGNATFLGNSSVTFDFQKSIAGVVSLTVGNSSSKDAFIGVTFTESSIWINSLASDGTADAGLDEPLWFPVGNGSSSFTADLAHQRGAFRYMTVVSNTSATVEVKSISIQFTAAPSQDLQAYTGYFHSNDELLNRIWYAGAYTNQLCSIDPVYGDAIPFNGIIGTNPPRDLPIVNEVINRVFNPASLIFAALGFPTYSLSSFTPK
jgi:hypothetical protein